MRNCTITNHYSNHKRITFSLFDLIIDSKYLGTCLFYCNKQTPNKVKNDFQTVRNPEIPAATP